MTTKKRKPATSTRRTTTRRRTSTTRKRTTPRRRTSTASTAGTAVGAAIAGVLAAALGGLPWWGWVLLIVVGLAIGLGWAAARGRKAMSDDEPEAPAAAPEG